MEEPVFDLSAIIQAASDFARFPGIHGENSIKDFLSRFPIPVIINVLETNDDGPNLENNLISCLEKIFKSKYGTSLIPEYLYFVQIGLKAQSHVVRSLACKIVTWFLECPEDIYVSAAKLIREHSIYPLLLNCIAYGDEQVATVSIDAILSLARFTECLKLIFPDDKNEITHLRTFSASCSSLARVRVLSLIVKLFSISAYLASIIHSENLLDLFEEEMKNADDVLVTLSVMELLSELAEVCHGREFLSRSSILQLLGSFIRQTSCAILRSRAMIICGRLLSKYDDFMLNEESGIISVISAICERMEPLGLQNTDECESALEAIGQIGASTRGAMLLLSISSVSRKIFKAAFDRQIHGRQLAALHSLSSILGATRKVDDVLLEDGPEECLRKLIYETASQSSKLTPSGLLFSILHQDSEIRLAAYMLITGMSARRWCLLEICLNKELVDIVTDSGRESTKICMEARHVCCEAILNALSSSSMPQSATHDLFADITTKLQEAVRNGPYASLKRRLPVPVVSSEQRY